MKSTPWLAGTLALALLPTTNTAQELALGLGTTDYPAAGEDSEILSLDYRHTPFFERGAFSAAFAATLSATTASDAFVGAGIGLRWSAQNGWFVDLSVMPGLHDAGVAGNDLGTTFNFRSLLGVGYQFDSGRSLSLAIAHKSNASIDTVNPGADVVLFRYHIPL